MKRSTLIILWRCLLGLLIIWLCLKIGGCMFPRPGPWGPRVGGVLPNGKIVFFQSRSFGKDAEDRLICIDNAGNLKSFWVQQYHASPSRVIVKYTGDGQHVWVEAENPKDVVASIDLNTCEFRPEDAEQFSWARYGEGIILAEGKTWNVLRIIAP